MAKRLPTTLQISHAKKLFCDLNECDYLDFIDFEGVIDKTLTYGENIEALESQYSQFSWDPETKITPFTYEIQFIDDLRTQASEFSYDILKKSKIEGLERSERRAIRLGKKLDQCEALPKYTPSIPGTCRTKQVDVKAHRRCLPRR